MVFNVIFNSISVILWHLVHLFMLSWSSSNQYSTQYSFQATGCFPTQPLSKRTAVREKWILSQWLSLILGKNIGWAGVWTSDLLFSSTQRYQLSYGAWHRGYCKESKFSQRWYHKDQSNTSMYIWNVSFENKIIWDKINLVQDKYFTIRQNSRPDQTESFCRRQNWIKNWNLSLKGQKTFWEKKKMLVTSIFSIFLNVFRSLLPWGR